MKQHRLTKQEKKQAVSLRKAKRGKRNLWVLADTYFDNTSN